MYNETYGAYFSYGAKIKMKSWSGIYFSAVELTICVRPKYQPWQEMEGRREGRKSKRAKRNAGFCNMSESKGS